jgi:Holliday junction resolvase RusA-like endonuclease
MSSIVFVVPGQPQGKGRPRIGKVGQHARMFTPGKTVAYEGLIAHAGQQAMQGRPLIDGAVSVVIDLRCQIPASWSKKKQAQALAGEVRPVTKPDTDNCVKAIFDGLNGVTWKDDVQVTEVTARKRYAEKPGVYVEIKPLESA